MKQEISDLITEFDGDSLSQLVYQMLEVFDSNKQEQNEAVLDRD